MDMGVKFGYGLVIAASAIMNARMTAIIVCLALASVPAAARTAKVARPAAPAGQNAAPQTTPPKSAPKTAKKPAPEKPGNKKAPDAIAKAYAAMPADERLAIQSDLAWTSYYEGPPGGNFDDERVIDAVKLFQTALKDKVTGIITSDERAHLAAAAEPAKVRVGWRMIDDPTTGARFGLPEKLVSPSGPARLGGRWISGHSQIEVSDFRLSEANLSALFEQEKKTPRGRYADSSTVTADSFVMSGTQGLKNFVVRAQSNGTQVRAITVLYDQATTGVMEPVAIAVANSFHGFPDRGVAPPPEEQRGVEYSTAIVADDSGDLVASAQGTDDCAAIAVPDFGAAVRIAADKANDLALIRLYGARNLAPAALATEGQTESQAENNVDDLALIGIADPAAQHGGDAVTKLTVRLDGQKVTPPPALGFSGAAAIDGQGRFAGMVELQSAADAVTGLAALQATLVPADAVRAFLTAHGIKPASGQDVAQNPMERSVLRVICVRK
jgi:hypothetical protein